MAESAESKNTMRVRLVDAGGAYVGHADFDEDVAGVHRVYTVGGKSYLWDARQAALVEQSGTPLRGVMVKDADMPERNPEAVHMTYLNPAGVPVKREFAELDPPPAAVPDKFEDKGAKVQG